MAGPLGLARKIVACYALMLLVGCAAAPIDKPAIAQTDIDSRAKLFFEIYAARQDIDSLMSFYHVDALLEDMVYGQTLQGKSAIKGFYNWQSQDVEILADQALVVTKQVVSGSEVITEGYFTPFLYHESPLGPWRFVIWQTYDSYGKVVYQADWINYTPKEQFVDGDNLNLRISASTP